MPEQAAERTEKPTQRRINKAHEAGQFPSSQELISAVSLISLMAVTYFMGPSFVAWALQQIREGFSCDYTLVTTPEAFNKLINEKALSTAAIVAPFLLALTVSGIAANIAISGFHFAGKGLEINLNMINPANGLKSLFSPTALVKLAFSVLKIIFISLIVYFYLRKKLTYLATFQYIWAADFLRTLSMLILGVVFRLCIGLLIIGFLDLIYQKWKYTKGLMMTKQEVKEETKDSESPQEVQKKIRQKQFEFAMRRMMQEVPKANVVIVNPTHVAVALRYDSTTMPAPVVVAKGTESTCEKIKEIARAYGVPIIRRPAIAREIYAKVDLGGLIPGDLFVAVAEILALVYRLKNRR
jgi:flagellar biosynthetic protein FlhB